MRERMVVRDVFQGRFCFLSMRRTDEEAKISRSILFLRIKFDEVCSPLGFFPIPFLSNHSIFGGFHVLNGQLMPTSRNFPIATRKNGFFSRSDESFSAFRWWLVPAVAMESKRSCGGVCRYLVGVKGKLASYR